MKTWGMFRINPAQPMTKASWRSNSPGTRHLGPDGWRTGFGGTPVGRKLFCGFLFMEGR
jgi:hypothetical protein